MSDYRAYIVDSDGHFKRSVELDCLDDEIAKEQAKQLVDGHDVELWQRARKVAVFEHKLLNVGKDGQVGVGTPAGTSPTPIGRDE